MNFSFVFCEAPAEASPQKQGVYEKLNLLCCSLRCFYM